MIDKNSAFKSSLFSLDSILQSKFFIEIFIPGKSCSNLNNDVSIYFQKVFGI